MEKRRAWFPENEHPVGSGDEAFWKEERMMTTKLRRAAAWCLLLALVLAPLSGCASGQGGKDGAAPDQSGQGAPDTSQYLVVLEDEPDTVDFQCTSIHYTIAQNVFGRLVEMENNENGGVDILPSLAESWDISEDRCSYTFHLRENVRFSNGSVLTSSDVGYTLNRLLTHPDSCNQDIAECILGAAALESGEATELAGFQALSDRDFTITLEEPFEAFLACMSMPGASILDEETTQAAGERFGLDCESTVGTGSFIMQSWDHGKGMMLRANQDCWAGAPSCAGVDLRFVTESESVRRLFENGELDILDLDELGNEAEFFFRGDIYQDRLHQVQQIGISYLALNESFEALQDARVRRALQLALNRTVLLDAVYSGRGSVEQGIFPHGLNGFNQDLPEIPYDPDQARALLEEAGFGDGFDMTISVKSSATQWENTLANLAVSMWEKVGVHTKVDVLEESEFMSKRKSGELMCYPATWTADYNDPDNFIYTFFGNKDNTNFRSLCYPREEIMERVRKARAISDQEARIQEYQELERIIVQEDAAWIPLFSRLRYYVVSENLRGFRASWNGSVKNNYRHMSVN